MKVKDIMTKTIASLNPDDTIEHAAQLMNQHDVGSVPVCSGERLVGIVTDRDIAVRAVAKGENTHNQHVSEIMSSNPIVGNPDMDIHAAAQMMSDRQIRRLPIVENNNLVGIVALGDLAVEPKLSDNAGDALSSISEPASPNI